MALYLAAALLPIVPAVAAIAAAVEPGAWWGVDAALVRGVTPDALLYTAICVVIAAPIAGVAVTSNRRLLIAIVVFCAMSTAFTLARLGLAADTLRFVATSHAVLASATLALAGLGAWLGSVLREPLDAAALALIIALTAAYGVLVAGAPVGALSPLMLKAALLASPVMSVASAAHVDLVRSDIWYQISPLAHVHLEYPAWTTICGSYLLAGGAGFAATMWCRPGRGPEREQGL